MTSARKSRLQNSTERASPTTALANSSTVVATGSQSINGSGHPSGFLCLVIDPNPFTCVHCHQSGQSTSRNTKYCKRFRCQEAKRMETAGGSGKDDKEPDGLDRAVYLATRGYRAW